MDGIKVGLWNPETLCNLNFKMILLGDANVGKSNLINRFIKNEFNTLPESTIGPDFFTHAASVDNENVRM